MILYTITIFLFSYLIGSIPTGFWAGKLLKGIDIRDYGSGNIGATNIVRVFGYKVGVTVLLIDILKAFSYIFWVKQASDFQNSSLLILCSLILIIGNIFPIFLKFKGGKGVATSTGVFSALVPLPFFIALLSFLIVVSLTKYVSLGSLIGAVILFLLTLFFYLSGKGYDINYIVLIGVINIFIFVKHRANIGRLVRGTENKLKFKNKVK